MNKELSIDVRLLAVLAFVQGTVLAIGFGLVDGFEGVILAVLTELLIVGVGVELARVSKKVGIYSDEFWEASRKHSRQAYLELRNEIWEMRKHIDQVS